MPFYIVGSIKWPGGLVLKGLQPVAGASFLPATDAWSGAIANSDFQKCVLDISMEFSL